MPTLLRDRAPASGETSRQRRADVVVIGAGQAGLSAAYHLQRRGYGSALEADARSFVLLDGEDGPGGAWRHRWDSLRMATVNGIHDLPGMEQEPPDDCEPSNAALPRYFAQYEERFELPVVRPVRVEAVERADDDPQGPLVVRTDRGTWLAGAVVNATGTWQRPYWPYYPGRETFLGRQLHTADYVSAEELRGQHVVVVGGGISAVQLLDEISQVTSTTWVTRREPVWREGPFGPDEGREAVAKVEERVRAGLPPRSVVSVTGLLWTPALRAAARRGALDRRPMFERVEPDGVRWADGTFQRADVILWATGFRAQLDHLAPLRLRGRGGGIVMDGTRVAAEPRVHLIGYGPSSSTVGANRAGRDAVREIDAFLAARRRRSADDGK
ncbi:NAD(P)-binding domain-containing protein [Georgenia phoenicis]|uniref:NAD(P)-binding domain-containing protein n=1 Tax=unclassified Georgenia TaxID=2626815 RepID=UPI0039B07FE4